MKCVGGETEGQSGHQPHSSISRPHMHFLLFFGFITGLMQAWYIFKCPSIHDWYARPSSFPLTGINASFTNESSFSSFFPKKPRLTGRLLRAEPLREPVSDMSDSFIGSTASMFLVAGTMDDYPGEANTHKRNATE